MKKAFFVITVSLVFASASAQRLNKITLGDNGSSTIFSYLVDEAITINLSTDGKIIEWGLENKTGRGYPERLYEYMGRVEYYDSNENEAYRGKVKYLGRTAFSYYTSNDNEAFKGKVKTMNTITFDYYPSYENEALRGKIRNAGPLSITYYSSYDNEAYKGKLKSVGATAITYYASFDDKAYRGKIKNIDRFTFTYYSSYDIRDYQGTMKTGFPTQNINGINYFIRNY